MDRLFSYPRRVNRSVRSVKTSRALYLFVPCIRVRILNGQMDLTSPQFLPHRHILEDKIR